MKNNEKMFLKNHSTQLMFPTDLGVHNISTIWSLIIFNFYFIFNISLLFVGFMN